MLELRSNSFRRRPELRESQEKNNKKVKRVDNVQVNLKNIELFCAESNKSNLVNHREVYGKKEVGRVGLNQKTGEL